VEESRPLLRVVTLGAKKLDSIVLAISDEDSAVEINPDAMGGEKLARAATWTPASPLKFAVRAETVDCSVSVAVRHVYVAIRANSNVRWVVERCLKPGTMPSAEGNLKPPLEVEAENLMGIPINQEHAIVGRDEDSMRIGN
jgi:hypothetical protein